MCRSAFTNPLKLETCMNVQMTLADFWERVDAAAYKEDGDTGCLIPQEGISKEYGQVRNPPFVTRQFTAFLPAVKRGD